MDVRKLEKHTAVDTPRPPLVPAERNDNAAEAPNRRLRTREVTSRYKSPSPSTPSVSRRCPSPNLSRTLPVSSQVVPKRAQSAERRRPSKPSSPPSPSSTPVRDSPVDGQLSSSRRLSMGSRLPEGLWPSTMRSLSVSFQSDTISIPVSKKEKPVSSVSSDRTLRPPSNVAQKQGELAGRSRKSTPERKRSPLKGKNVQDQAENAKPPDVLHTRLIDQHRWPSRTGAKVSSISLNKSVDLTEKTVKPLSTPAGIGLSSLRRNLISDGMHGMHKPLQKSNSDASRLLSAEFGRVGSKLNPVDDSLALLSEVQKLVSNELSDRTSLTNPSARSHSLPSSGSRPASPSRTSASRGVSPARPRPTTPPSRGVSPSRIRSSTGSIQSSTSSVLSFIVDVKKGKKGAGYIEEAHQLRLLYNRYLQWRFANARAESVLFILKVTAEKTLYNVWEATLALWDSAFSKRVKLRQLNLDLKLNAILNGQMGYLDEWALIGRDHLNSLSGAVQDLQSSTLRLPVTGGAKADIETLRVAVCSAMDVMQAMGSSMCSLLSRVEDMNALVSELAVVAARERTMLDECEALLASTAAMQVEEYSNRTHLLQIKDVC